MLYFSGKGHQTKIDHPQNVESKHSDTDTTDHNNDIQITTKSSSSKAAADLETNTTTGTPLADIEKQPDTPNAAKDVQKGMRDNIPTRKSEHGDITSDLYSSETGK